MAKRRKTSQVLQRPGVGALSTGTDKSVSQEILPDRPRYIKVEKPCVVLPYPASRGRRNLEHVQRQVAGDLIYMLTMARRLHPAVIQKNSALQFSHH